jgi:2-polyprenyl-3-methyl-5-hydroxy-6-metoxy-1,4-benzoquinol methylase
MRSDGASGRQFVSFFSAVPRVSGRSDEIRVTLDVGPGPPRPLPTARELRRRFPNDGYVAYHAQRYAELLEILHALPPRRTDRVLDIGRSNLTTLIAEVLDVPVDSLGFADDEVNSRGRHYQFDLNRAQHVDRWRTDLPVYELVVLAEVIEHLHTAPSLVLRFLRTLLADNGYLVVQTPNAATLSRRLKMLVGVNPYALISEDADDPQHFREYTRQELTNYAEEAGFGVQNVFMRSYFDQRFQAAGSPSRTEQIVGAAQNATYRRLPPSLRTGMTFILRAGPNHPISSGGR